MNPRNTWQTCFFFLFKLNMLQQLSTTFATRSEESCFSPLNILLAAFVYAKTTIKEVSINQNQITREDRENERKNRHNSHFVKKVLTLYHIGQLAGCSRFHQQLETIIIKTANFVG